MYGGRVTDDCDRRVLNCYLKEYLGDFIFDTNQKFLFAQTAKADYMIPDNESFEQTFDFIE
jgi:dynein heavy chain